MQGAAGLQPPPHPQQSCYILHFIGFRFKTRSHVKIVFYTNQIQSNSILRELSFSYQRTDAISSFAGLPVHSMIQTRVHSPFPFFFHEAVTGLHSLQPRS
ncbi:hypothetical protein C0J52_04670 [Blattella germanica]|nr:hypothetical protein C0J52_04670 [Blattella germanica]